MFGSWFEESSNQLLDFSWLKNYVSSLWSLRGGVKISTFGALLLFDFDESFEVERVLVRGARRFKENFLHLERRHFEVGCLRKGGSLKELWVRVLGLPLHLWGREVFKKLGDCCGGFVAMGEDTVLLSHLQWARILVKNDGRVLPGSLQIDVGCFNFFVQLWWEAPPWVSMESSSSSCNGHYGQEDREEVEGGPRACESV